MFSYFHINIVKLLWGLCKNSDIRKILHFLLGQFDIWQKHCDKKQSN